MTAIMTPEISVIIPVYRDLPRLALCLDALTRQSLPADRFEIIVVDNAPEPHVPPESLPANARLVHEPMAGSYVARNAGVAVARAPFLGFVDSDCIPDEQWLEHGLAALRAYPGSRITGPVKIFREHGGGRYAHMHDLNIAFPNRRYVAAGHCVTANLLVARTVFDEVGPFDLCLSGGDARWGRKAAAAGVPIRFEDDVSVRHPARRSVREIFRKSRRTAGSSPRDARFFLRNMKPPLNSIARFRREGLSRAEALIVFSIYWASRLIQAQEFGLVRLRLKRPNRS